MPLGNLTSQFFANIYLNEFDYFVKHELKAKYYVRYVDDFIILRRSKKALQDYETKICEFLKNVGLQLHPQKCSIIPLKQGIPFLGFKLFYRHKIVRQRNVRKICYKLAELLNDYSMSVVDVQHLFEVLHGWNAYAMHANTYRLRQMLIKNTNAEIAKRSASPRVATPV